KSAAPDLQIRAQPLADLQIGVVDGSRPVPQMKPAHLNLSLRLNYRSEHNPYQISRSALWTGLDLSLQVIMAHFKLPLRLISRSERTPLPISRSAWTGRNLFLRIKRDTAIY